MKNSKAYYKCLNLIRGNLQGTLNTNSVMDPGYPFGSFVRYAFDFEGNIILLLSSIAEHTQNFLNDNRVSLTIIDRLSETLSQEVARATILGEINKIQEPLEEKTVYEIFFPESSGFYDQFHDFNFYKLSMKKIRFIGGFAQAYWLEVAEVQKKQFLGIEEQNMIVDHMNNEHCDTLIALILFHFKINIINENNIKLIYCDSNGLWIKYKTIYYIPFKKDAKTIGQVKKEIIQLSKFAKQNTQII